jgi:acetyl-CoA carboxylase biotin carboxyl carrier protein
MEIKDIRQLIKLVENANITELEIKEEGKEIRISKNNKHSSDTIVMSGGHMLPYPAQAVHPGMPPSFPPIAATAQATENALAAEKTPANQMEIRSPMVGTFYRSPAPDAETYTEIGQRVEVGQTLCIIEAMKLMNEIESEYNGKIAKILVENAQPVEYNRTLFLIEKS